MKPLHYILLAGALALVGRSAQAQQRNPSEAATAEQRLVEDIGALPAALTPSAAGDVRNTSTLFQTGAGNNASIDQRSLSNLSNQAYIVQAGAANVLGIIQSGGDNRAYMSQQGNGNRADFTQNGQGNSSNLTQRGSNNRLQGLVSGNDNELNIQQNGANNQVQSEIRQNDRTYNISQIGYGNTLTQKETTTQSPQGYSVEMRGAGINITIEQGRVGR
jgi:minor curlin subunit